MSEFVIYPLAIRMKALGFDEPCFGCYLEIDEFLNIEFTKNQNCFHGQIASAPTWQSAFAWLIPQINDEYKVSFRKEGWFIYNLEDGEFKGSEALEKLIEIIERKSKNI